MTQRAMIHIGVPKTGSTALQKFFCDNRAALRAAGWLYPESVCRGFGQHDLAFLLGGGYPDWATPQDRSLVELLAALRREIASTPHRHLLISSEDFYLLCPPQALADCMAELGYARDEIGIVVYLRRQDEAVESWYNQAVKAQGYAGTLAEHVAEAGDLWSYATRLETWAAVFGTGNLRVRRYRTADFAGRDVRRDFMQALDIDTADCVFSEARENTELNRDILEFQRQLNRQPLSVQEKRQFHRELIALTAAARGSGLFVEASCMNHAMREHIMAAHADDNAAVAACYFGGESLFEPLPTPTAAEQNRAIENDEYCLTPDKQTYIQNWLTSKLTIKLTSRDNDHAGEAKERGTL